MKIAKASWSRKCDARVDVISLRVHLDKMSRQSGKKQQNEDKHREKHWFKTPQSQPSHKPWIRRSSPRSRGRTSSWSQDRSVVCFGADHVLIHQTDSGGGFTPTEYRPTSVPRQPVVHRRSVNTA